MNDSEIYDMVRWDLMRYATALAGPSDAEDVVSTVVARVLAHRNGLVGLREPKPYLMRAVLNEVRTRHRRRRPEISLREPLVADSMVIEKPPSPVVDLIKGLPPQQRAAAFLVFYEEYTPSEAAEVMGCRPATVRRYVYLARRKLQEVLDG